MRAPILIPSLILCSLLVAATPLNAQSRIEVDGRWSESNKGDALVTSIVNCYRIEKTCTVISPGVGGNIFSSDYEIVEWDSQKIVAIGGGDCVTNTLVINLSRKTVSLSSASNHEQSKDGFCQDLDNHPDWIKPATLIQPPGGWFLVY